MARLTRNCMLVFVLLVATAAVGFARDHEREGHHHRHYRIGVVYYSGPVQYYSVPRYYDRYCYEDRDCYCEECYEDYVRYVPRGRVHVDIVVNAYGHHDHYYRHRHHHDDDDDD